jgi:hypothetical protein
MMVVDSSDLRGSVKFSTRENDFPKFVETGTVFRKFLETDTSRGARPYQFSARVVESKRELNFSGDTLLWMPLSSDTGQVHLKIVVTDTFLTSDTLYPSMLVVPPNRPLKLELLNFADTTSAGAIDLSDSSGSVTLDFHIADPDTDLVEQFTASVIRKNRSNLLEINKERNFSLSLFSSEVLQGTTQYSLKQRTAAAIPISVLLLSITEQHLKSLENRLRPMVQLSMTAS